MTEGKTLEVCYFEPYERENLYHLNPFPSKGFPFDE